jgi:hypothetical protein
MGIQLSMRSAKPPDTVPARSRPPVLIGSLASGSGGVNLFLTYRFYMAVAGRARRLHPPLLVNFNKAENGRITTLLEPHRSSGRLFAILPKHVHTASEGFGGDPTAWKEDEGLITLDLENMASRSSAWAHRIGSQPGIILEFLVGGGGHAELGLIVHQQLKKDGVFPNCVYLPVFLIPDEPMQYGFLRVYSWEKFEESLHGLWGLIIDNASKPHYELNDLLAIGLTSLDACSSSVLTSGSLRQAVLSLLHAVRHQYQEAENGSHPTANGFFRTAVVRRKVRSRRVWRFGIPLRQRKLIRSNNNELEHAIRAAIKECLETPAGLLDTNPLPGAGIPQVVAVSVPVKPEALSDIVRSVKAILSREAWWQSHKDTTNLLWGSINFPDPIALDVTNPEESIGFFTRLLRACFWLVTSVPRLLHLLVFGRNHQQKDLYMTVTRLFPELGALNRLHHILHPDGLVTNGAVETGHGFGTKQHLLTTPPEQNSHVDKEPVRE